MNKRRRVALKKRRKTREKARVKARAVKLATSGTTRRTSVSV